MTKYDQRDIISGKYGDKIPWIGVDAGAISSYMKYGKNCLKDVLRKDYATMFADGRIMLHRDAFPMFGSGIEDIQSYLRRPLSIFAEPGTSGTLVPQHPLDMIQKATVTSGDAGAFNAIFGAIALIQISQQQNAFAAMPKRGYERAGFRAVSAAAIASGAGVAEGGAVPTAVEPTYQEINVGLKDQSVATEMSTRLELQSTRNDTVTFAGNAQVVFSNFMEAIDVDLLKDWDTLAGNNMESIDRLTADSAAQVALGYTADDENLYGVDRSANTWFDSNLDHNSNVDRAVSISLLDALYRDQYEYWGTDIGNKFWLTGTSTHVPWSALEGSKQRFDQATVVNTIAGGVQPVVGQAGGFKLSTYLTWPIVLDQNVEVDTIARVYLIDQNHAGIVLGRPIEAIQGNHPVYVGSFVNRLVFYGIMELWGDLPKSCGQLRDLL